MASREQEIIAEARVTLGDTSGERWSDKRLFKLLNDAQKEVCREIPLISRKYTMNTTPGQEEYRMPSDCLKVLSAKNNGSLKITSMDELDEMHADWETLKGSRYSHLVVNNLSQLTVRPYPLMTDDSPSENRAIYFRYSAKPITLGFIEADKDAGVVADTEEELMLEDTWDYGLTQYVISKAFIDYGDAASLSRAQVAEGLYIKVMSVAMKLSKKSFSKRVFTTPFQGRVSSSSNMRGCYASNSRFRC